MSTSNTSPLHTETLWQQHLQQQLLAPPTFDPREIRLSEAGQCGRRQTLRALGYTPTLPTPRELAIFETGHWVEDRIAAIWDARFPGRINRQVTVTSPFGTGHIDIYVEPLNHIVECKTTTEKHRGDLPLKSHVDQVTLYLHYWGNALQATAEIAYYIKETGALLSFPVTYDAERAKDLIVGLLAVQHAIHILQEPLPIPDDYQANRYPCAWYTVDGLSRCPFWEHCWGAAIAPAAPTTQGPAIAAPALADDAATYAQLRQQEQLLNRQLEVLEATRKQFEAGFRTLLTDRQAQVLHAGEWIIKRTPIHGRTTYDVPAAIADGVIDRDAIAPYTTTHPDYDRWTIKKAASRTTATTPKEAKP